MPRVTHNQTNFTAGELSPKLYGRVDINKYGNGAAILENVIPLVEGGAISRNGTRFVNPSKYGAAKKSRLVPFVFNRDQSYVLEFSEKSVRFYRDNAIILDSVDNITPYEIETPYLDDQIDDLNFAQKSDTLIIVHRDVEPHKLQRFGDDNWQFSPIEFVSKPVDESGYRPESYAVVETIPTAGQQILTGNSIKVSAYIDDAATLAAADFITADKGRYISFPGGVAGKITKVDTAGLYVEATVTNAPGTIIAPRKYQPGTWLLQGSPRSALTPSATGPEGSTINLQAGGAGSSGASYNITKYDIMSMGSYPDARYNVVGVPTTDGTYYFDGLYLWAYVIVDHAAHAFSVGDRVQISGFTDIDGVDNINGIYTVRLIHSATRFSISKKYLIGNKNGPIKYDDVAYEVGLIEAAGAAGSRGSVTKVSASGASVSAFRPEDIGGVVSINGGTVRITEYITPSYAKGVVTKTLKSAVTAIKDAWSLALPVWNIGNGYPGAVTIAVQRLIFGGSPAYPNSIWMSRIGEYYNNDTGIDDSDAISISISSRDVVDVRHIIENNGIVVLSAGGEYAIIGGVEKPVTPTNVQIKSQSSFGCDAASPVKVGAEVLYPQRAGKRIRAMSYQYGTDSYASPDISAIADHMLQGICKAVAYQQEPYSALWIVTKSGELVSCTLNREQDVIGWARHTSGNGVFESVCSIPNGDVDDVWIVIKRTIKNVSGNDTEARYIERFDPTLYHDCAGEDGSLVVADTPYSDEAETLFARMTTAPTSARKRAIADAIDAMKTAGIWDKLDMFYMFTAANSQAAYLDWRRGSKQATAAFVTFTADSGVAGDGATSYLNLGFIPTSDGVNYTLNDACHGVYVKTQASSSSSYLGAWGSSAGLYSDIVGSTGVLSGRANSLFNISTVTSISSGEGLAVINRTASNSTGSYFNGASVSAETDASTGLPDKTMYALARNNNGVTDQFSNGAIRAAFAGASLTTTEQSTLKTIIDTYLAAL